MPDVSSFDVVSRTLDHVFNANPFLIDVGASEGRYTSNSFYLLNECGWGGILIEPMPHQFKDLQERYKDREDILCLNAALTEEDGLCEIHLHPHDGDGTTTGNHGSSLIKPRGSVFSIKTPALSFETLCNMLSGDVGLLSVDTEGYDPVILNGLLSLGMRPQAIVTETFFEDNDLEKHALLKSFGYKLVVNTGHDTGWILEK